MTEESIPGFCPNQKPASDEVRCWHFCKFGFAPKTILI